MITHETVFILGAGASKPYGYPTGIDLLSDICFDFPSKLEGLVIKGEHIAPEYAAASRRKAEDFAQVLKDASNPSIDLYLARNGHRSDVVEFGKKAIIISILDREEKSQFGLDLEDRREDWYSYLFKRMTEQLITPDSFTRFGDNKVTFITFNYDRSLEHFLHTSLSNTFSSAEPPEIVEQLTKIKIHHVYGVIAFLPWQIPNQVNQIPLSYKSSNHYVPR